MQQDGYVKLGGLIEEPPARRVIEVPSRHIRVDHRALQAHLDCATQHIGSLVWVLHRNRGQAGEPSGMQPAKLSGLAVALVRNRACLALTEPVDAWNRDA